MAPPSDRTRSARRRSGALPARPRCRAVRLGAVRHLSRAPRGPPFPAGGRRRRTGKDCVCSSRRPRPAADQEAQSSESSERKIMKDERRLEIGMLLYPGLTLLDLIGPQTVFSWYANTHLVWKTKDLVYSDTGIGMQPTCTFETCPRELDVLFMPGGFGQMSLMNDAQVLAFLADRAATSKYITSVCSGSLLLGAAGL